MPRYRLLALDVDGTLLNSRDELTPITRDAVRRAKAAGVEVVVATGRRYRRVLPLVEPLGLDVPLITASGALSKHPADHRTLFKAHFAPEVLKAWLAVVAGHGYEAVLYADTYDEGFDYYCSRLQVGSQHLDEFLTLNAGSERVWAELMTHPPSGVFAGFVIGDRPQMLALAAELDRQFPDKLYVHVLRSPRYAGFMCEISPFGVSKWSGICHFANERNIPAEAICAVGDDVNDIPMIEAAGLGVAMENAVEELKAAADRIAPSHDEDGVAKVVEWILE